MRIPSLLFVCALLGSSAWAQDDESPFYFRLGFGGVFSEDADVLGITTEFDPGFSLAAAVGYTFELNERWDLDADVEAFRQSFKIEEGDIGGPDELLPGLENVGSADNADTFAFMLNGTFVRRMSQNIGLYGGLGLGWSKNDYNGWDSGDLRTDDEDGVAFQGRLGVEYGLGGSYDFRLGYRYFRASPVDVLDVNDPAVSDELDIGQHSFEITFLWAL